ncbi:MAG: type II secretion system protein, partial [Vicinamibacterales bacterium]
MRLHGQHGYAMVALIVGMSIVAILMTAVMPAWSQLARREREAELVFRGEQYARAIGLFQRRAGPGVLPPSVDVLVEQKLLRRKYKDPITNDDFALLSALTPAAGPAG